MLVFIIIVLAVAGITYFVVKSKAHLSSTENSIKPTIEKVEAAATSAIEEVEDTVKAVKAAPKSKTTAKIKTAAKKVTSNK
jgi:hypothetical protein